MEVAFSFEAVVFDLDGTLINSHTAMMRAYSTWANEFDLDLAELPKYLGMPNTTLASLLLPPDVAEVASRRIEHLETTDTDGVIALPGALEAFASLPHDRYAVGTSCTWDLMAARMGAAGLALPPVVVTRDQVLRGKPDPDTFLEACERLGRAPSDVVVFEDAPAGVQAARNAGCMVVGVLSTQTPEVLQADAHVVDLSPVTWHVGERLGLTIAA